jgi:superfamily II RNA helicase
MNLKRMCLIVRYWYEGSSFTDLLEITNVEEGNLIHIFRNSLDLARQVKHATSDTELKDRMAYIIKKLDRDVIKVSF